VDKNEEDLKIKIQMLFMKKYIQRAVDRILDSSGRDMDNFGCLDLEDLDLYWFSHAWDRPYDA
jgi:hypothetical protein